MELNTITSVVGVELRLTKREFDDLICILHLANLNGSSFNGDDKLQRCWDLRGTITLLHEKMRKENA